MQRWGEDELWKDQQTRLMIRLVKAMDTERGMSYADTMTALAGAVAMVARNIGDTNPEKRAEIEQYVVGKIASVAREALRTRRE